MLNRIASFILVPFLIILVFLVAVIIGIFISAVLYPISELAQ